MDRMLLVAYFSMEIALESSIPTYSGGLGVLAGDTLRAAADLGIPMVGVTLLHRRGYFYQRVDSLGRQSEEPVSWSVDDFLEPMEPHVTVTLEDRPVQIRTWRYQFKGVAGHIVPVYLLDSNLKENAPEDRTLTDHLYGGDDSYRLRQEAVLGLGGIRMLRALGYQVITRFHLNEGHAALLILALLEEQLAQRGESIAPSPEAIETVAARCVFTTHTPVPAGHDQFSLDLVRHVVGERRVGWLKACGQDQNVNLTDVALRCSRFINGVAMKHGEVSRTLFPGYPIRSITNGVHAVTWAAPSFQALYDRLLPDWRRDQLSLRYAVSIPEAEIWEAHMDAKRALVDAVNRGTNAGFDHDVLTLGFARRATGYKRWTLMFRDLDRLRRVVAQVGRLQIVFAGKAHPRDHDGKEVIRQIHTMREALKGVIPVAYLANYDMALARQVCAGVDVWLNTPIPPLEASGTSGMKAAINGVPSLSVLDGWWIEGHVEDVTGWSIGEGVDACLIPASGMDACHADALYDKLAKKVAPCFYEDRSRFVGIMRHTIALNGGFFNTHRMMSQYVYNAYRLPDEPVEPLQPDRSHMRDEAG
ncbi:MAG: alpha-glucan family phosphorylase [Nitrospira sp.]